MDYQKTKTQKKSNLSSPVYSELKQRIIRWQYPPGYRFTEERLCNEFGMSRSPVREALRMLVENGLVEKVPHRGYSVKQPDLDEVRDLYDVRLALESFTAEHLAVKGLPQADLDRLRHAWNGLLSQLPQIDADNAAREDEVFHETLAQATGNRALRDLLSTVDERLRFVRLTDITTVERLRATCQQHLKILDCIAAKNVAGAREAMRENIEHGRQNVEAAFKEALAGAYRGQ